MYSFTRAFWLFTWTWQVQDLSHKCSWKLVRAVVKVHHSLCINSVVGVRKVGTWYSSTLWGTRVHQTRVSMSSPTIKRMRPCSLQPSRPILNVWSLWWGGGHYVEMNSVRTNSGGTAPGVGMNLISSLPCTSTRTVPVVSGGDVWVVGNGDVEIRSNESSSHHLCNHSHVIFTSVPPDNCSEL